MNTITRMPKQLKVYGAMLAFAALVFGLMAVALPAGTAHAQSPDNTYPDPQPCGPDAGTAFQPEPHEITTGHFAFFDAYWSWKNKNPNSGVLHTNLCPPKMVKATRVDPVTEKEVEVLVRSVSNIDVDEAIMHVLDKHKVTVVNTNAEATSGQLSLEEYPEVKKAAPAGSKVWWLRLDDPDTVPDETSDLVLGFSTEMFDYIYWLSPMSYKFEVERYPGSDPANVPHFFAYEAPLDDNQSAKIVWDSTKPGADKADMEINPDQYRPLQWVFTKPGTYILSVHLVGKVRGVGDKLSGFPEGWKPISGNVTETSEVKKYSFYVGDKLEEMEPPLFGINLSIAENSSGGTKIGNPIPVYQSEASELKYQLDGDEFGDFKLIPSTDPHSVQIAVSDGGILDFETKPSYDLVLSVTDNVDHENNPDPTVDDTLAVRVNLTDVIESGTVAIRASDSTPAPGKKVTIRAILGDVFDIYPGTVTYIWRERDKGASLWTDHEFSTPTWTFTARHDAGVTKEYVLEFMIDDGSSTTTVGSDPITVTWGNSSSN